MNRGIQLGKGFAADMRRRDIEDGRIGMMGGQFLEDKYISQAQAAGERWRARQRRHESVEGGRHAYIWRRR